MDRKQQLKTPPISLLSFRSICRVMSGLLSLDMEIRTEEEELSWVWIWGKERIRDHPSGHVLPCQGRALPLLGELLHPDFSQWVPIGAARWF